MLLEGSELYSHFIERWIGVGFRNVLAFIDFYKNITSSLNIPVYPNFFFEFNHKITYI